jgi:AcrR family transcriptional regulator
MVASVAERGYGETRITDLVEISGISRRAFYDLFPDMAACFVATLEALVGVGLKIVEHPAGTWEEQVRSGAAGFAELIVAQPAAARLCLLEAFAVGRAGLSPLEAATAKLEARARKMTSESSDLAGMPPEMITADVGAILEITRNLLRKGREAELPDVMNHYTDLVLSHRPPPEPLRLTTRPPSPAPETIEAHDHGERALRAFAVVAAEQGYANTTINEVVKRASMSPRTFYADFRDKEDAMLAAIDSAGAQIVAATLPAFRRNPNWLHGVRAAFGAFFNFLASRPALAQLMLVEVYAAGPKAIERREEALHPLEGPLVKGGSSQSPSIMIETIRGGIHALAYKQICDSGPESLPGLAPVCTYMSLAPFVGADEACTAANGDGRPRGAHESAELIRAAARGPLSHRVLQVLGESASSVEELARELDQGAEEVQRELEGLERAGLIEAVEEEPRDGTTARLYRSPRMGVITDAVWAQLSLTERHRISVQIGHLIQADLDRAAEAGTFDARIDRYLVRAPLRVDEQGWDELAVAYTEIANRIFEIQARSTERLEKSGETAIAARGILTLFEMPAGF